MLYLQLFLALANLVVALPLAYTGNLGLAALCLAAAALCGAAAIILAVEKR